MNRTSAITTLAALLLALVMGLAGDAHAAEADLAITGSVVIATGSTNNEVVLVLDDYAGATWMDIAAFRAFYASGTGTGTVELIATDAYGLYTLAKSAATLTAGSSYAAGTNAYARNVKVKATTTGAVTNSQIWRFVLLCK